MSRCGVGLGVAAVMAAGWMGCSSGGAGAMPQSAPAEGARVGVHVEMGCTPSPYDMPRGPRGFIVYATVSNTSGNSTHIPNPCLGYPDGGTPPAAQTLAVTQVWNPYGNGGTYNPHHVGVWFDGASWNVFNEDGAAIPIGAAFAVVVADMDTVTAGPAGGKVVPIKDPSTTDPSAAFILTHVWNPPGQPAVYDNHEPAVQLFSGMWSATTGDGAGGVAPSASFNATAPGAFTTFAKQVIGNFTLIDNPLTNGNPKAVVLITQNLSPGGVPAPAIPSPLGVWYDNGAQQWSVFNEDLKGMTQGAAFNVWVL